MTTDLQDHDYLRALTLLYVEDEEDTREQFALFLGRLVGRLIVAGNGEEGITAYREQHPDIIVTDIQMPVMDGLAMVREIRALSTTVPIIILTAFEKVDYLKRSINLGVNRYLSKPVNGFEFRETLHECARELKERQGLESAARIDPLTGLANRRELMSRFVAEKARSERSGLPMSIAIADIDHFKQVNDTFGHLAGDQVLKHIAALFSSLLRASDLCGRWGGEEFLLLLPDTGQDDAVLVAGKLRRAVGGQMIEWDGLPIRVTISIGVAMLLPGMTVDECVSQADKALYRAKTGGRDRVEAAGC